MYLAMCVRVCLVWSRLGRVFLFLEGPIIGIYLVCGRYLFILFDFGFTVPGLCTFKGWLGHSYSPKMQLGRSSHLPEQNKDLIQKNLTFISTRS
ncbi:uncharacterized protein BDW43DRAFT_151503 [Aspergillus alliaceus]|uniref:uncharacterized protein n=1 Tax=Petromyces alliaceus TaxID=209559 RepID=UPI0012A471A8|nr:uncharacterized protein BDW43DRAFT_151503 [Aspergillus alliaceus]KAB8237997.1 hypothetical protein BDW43DRAFT_151503 [Aspergillus alliaceus]